MLNAEAPGTLALFDVAPVMVPVDHGLKRLVLSCYQLEWSGQYCCGLDDRATLDVLLWRLELAFRKTGGVPDRVGVRPIRPLAAPARAQGAWSAPFDRFIRHFGFQPVKVQPLHLQGLRDTASWLERGPHDSLDECLAKLDTWPGPLEAEREALKPLPGTGFVSGKECARRVASDGFVLFAGDAYSVPVACTARTVWIRKLGRSVAIYAQTGTHLTTHAAGTGSGQVIMKRSHFEAGRDRLEWATHKLAKAFLANFPQHGNFLSLLIAQRNLGAAASLRSLLALTGRHTRVQLQAAFDAAVSYNNLSHRFIQGFLEAGGQPPPEPAIEPLLQGTLF